jgi:uncharacterized protein YueI
MAFNITTHARGIIEEEEASSFLSIFLASPHAIQSKTIQMASLLKSTNIFF